MATQLTQRRHSHEAEKWPQWVSWEETENNIDKINAWEMGCLCGYFALLLQQIFIEPLLHARYYSKHWKYSSEQKG